MAGPKLGRVSVVPNASRIRGVVASARPGPAGGQILEIDVSEVQLVGRLPNFAADVAGTRLEVHVPPGLERPLGRGAAVEAVVAFRGDERGGRFVQLPEEPKSG